MFEKYECFSNFLYWLFKKSQKCKQPPNISKAISYGFDHQCNLTMYSFLHQCKFDQLYHVLRISVESITEFSVFRAIESQTIIFDL